MFYPVWRSVVAWALMIGAASWVWLFRHSRPGLQRLLCMLPPLAVMHLVPLLFPFTAEPLPAMAAAFLCVRLTSGKVVAFILGRGALTLPLSYGQFVAVMLAPFMPAELAVARSPQRRHGSSTGRRNAASTCSLDVNTQVASATGFSTKASPPNSSSTAATTTTTWWMISPEQRFSIDSHSTTASPGDSPRSPAAAAAAAAAGPHRRWTTARQAAANAARDSARVQQAAPAHTHSQCQAQQQQCSSAGVPGRSGVAWCPSALLNAAICVAFCGYCCRSWAALVSVALHLSGMWFIWLSMQLIMAAASHPAKSWLGLRLAPHFINPFAASSLTDFWARRWNITQGLVLRFYVYEPIVTGRLLAAPAAAASLALTPAAVPVASPAQPDGKVLPAGHSICSSSGSSSEQPFAASGVGGPADGSISGGPSCSTHGPSILSSGAAGAAPARPPLLAGPSAAVAPRWRRQLAAAATFVVSGLEHELFLWYLLRTWDGRWLAFFSLQGLLLAVEARMKQAGGAAGLRLHPLVSSLAVLLVLGLTADALFWPPLVQPAMVRPLVAAMPRWLMLGGQ